LITHRNQGFLAFARAIPFHGSKVGHQMAAHRSKYARPIADLIGNLIDPAVRRRGFASADLIANWPDLVGSRFARCSQPDSLRWPKRAHWDEGGAHQPATLVVRCDGANAVFLQHSAAQLRDRINTFFGFQVVGAIKIIQKPLDQEPQAVARGMRDLTADQERRLDVAVDAIDKPDLKAAVRRLGAAVLSQTSRKSERTP
jgi:hypothetical protein